MLASSLWTDELGSHIFFVQYLFNELYMIRVIHREHEAVSEEALAMNRLEIHRTLSDQCCTDDTVPAYKLLVQLFDHIKDSSLLDGSLVLNGELRDGVFRDCGS